MIKIFSIFRNKPSDNPKFPTHTISTKIGEEFVKIGSCWTKDGKDGQKYLSCSLQDAWVSTKENTQSQKSYVIVAEEDLEVPKVEDHRAIDEDGRDLNVDSPF